MDNYEAYQDLQEESQQADRDRESWDYEQRNDGE